MACATFATDRAATQELKPRLEVRQPTLKIQVITNVNNGAGLQRDAALLADSLKKLGHEPILKQVRDSHTSELCDLNIFLELMERRFFRDAKRNWFIPNPEWWHSEWTDLLPKCDRILAKTRDAEKIFSVLHPRVTFTGFTSPDFLDPLVRRERRFFHLGGHSEMKNSYSILRAWREFHLPYPLTFIWTQLPGPPCTGLVTTRTKVDDAELKALYNSHVFHLCPSGYEGWGHYWHEALSCGANVIGTNHPPMSEFHALARVGAHLSKTQQLASVCVTEPVDIAEIVRKVAHLPEEVLAADRRAARASFERGHLEFTANLEKLLNEH